MDKLLNVYKPIGYTPFQMVELVKERYPELRDQKIGYAGRLDPMAHGVLLLMVGDACKRRDQYQSLPKVYSFTLLPGIDTDTYDQLGIIKHAKYANIHQDEIIPILKQFEGEFEQKYPPYSSYHINGKPLYQYAKEGQLDQIEIPSKTVKISRIEAVEELGAMPTHLLSRVEDNISKVSGDFRQAEILKSWRSQKEWIEGKYEIPYHEIEVEAESGTYVRAIAHAIGQKLGVGAIALDIFRISVGDFDIDDAIKLLDS